MVSHGRRPGKNRSRKVTTAGLRVSRETEAEAQSQWLVLALLRQTQLWPGAGPGLASVLCKCPGLTSATLTPNLSRAQLLAALVEEQLLVGELTDKVQVYSSSFLNHHCPHLKQKGPRSVRVSRVPGPASVLADLGLGWPQSWWTPEQSEVQSGFASVSAWCLPDS